MNIPLEHRHGRRPRDLYNDTLGDPFQSRMPFGYGTVHSEVLAGLAGWKTLRGDATRTRRNGNNPKRTSVALRYKFAD